MLQAWLWLPELPFSLEREKLPSQQSPPDGALCPASVAQTPLDGASGLAGKGSSSQAPLGAVRGSLEQTNMSWHLSHPGCPARLMGSQGLVPTSAKAAQPEGFGCVRALGSSGISSVFCQESKLPPYLGGAEQGSCTMCVCCRLYPVYPDTTELQNSSDFKILPLPPDLVERGESFSYGSCTFPCVFASRSGVLHKFRSGTGNRCC